MKFLGISDIQTALKQIEKILKNKAQHAYVFGSVASNSAVPYESDVDLLIVPKTRISTEEAYDLLKKPWETLMNQGLVLRPVVFDPKRHPPWLLQEARKGVPII